ncbi:MAG: hypothetical protein HUK17_02820 [Bacteroidales bacterium]|nr:hypothetical protein [Bacteroidales bacterium]
MDNNIPTILAILAIVMVIVVAKWFHAKLFGQDSKAKHPPMPQDEVYAAIAAAIHLYNQELHDEEPTVITIQKTERSWTPWNAKYISMNHYFQNRHF